MIRKAGIFLNFRAVYNMWLLSLHVKLFCSTDEVCSSPPSAMCSHVLRWMSHSRPRQTLTIQWGRILQRDFSQGRLLSPKRPVLPCTQIWLYSALPKAVLIMFNLFKIFKQRHCISALLVFFPGRFHAWKTNLHMLKVYLLIHCAKAVPLKFLYWNC